MWCRWMASVWLSVGPIVSACNVPIERFHRADAASDSPLDVLPQFTSCMGLAMTCGAGGNDNCCRAATVPGGTFYRSYDGVGYDDMSHPATVTTFVLDQYEVTVGRFRAFANAGLGTQTHAPAVGSGAHPKLPGSGWDSAWSANLAVDTGGLIAMVKCDSTYQTWTDAAGANESKPINCVTWYEAMAFCIWDGGYLPTEAEWNYAASGGSDQRVYPWSMNPASSTSIDCTYANYRVDSPPGIYCVNNTTGAVNRVGSESPKGDARWSHSDLSGNVWEWVLDWYVSPAYSVPCNDCANLTPTIERVIRGGAFNNATSLPFLRTAFHGGHPPTSRGFDVGVRCARTSNAAAVQIASLAQVIGTASGSL
jgi:formylglycine-generating enzyme